MSVGLPLHPELQEYSDKIKNTVQEFTKPYGDARKAVRDAVVEATDSPWIAPKDSVGTIFDMVVPPDPGQDPVGAVAALGGLIPAFTGRQMTSEVARMMPGTTGFRLAGPAQKVATKLGDLAGEMVPRRIEQQIGIELRPTLKNGWGYQSHYYVPSGKDAVTLVNESASPRSVVFGPDFLNQLADLYVDNPKLFNPELSAKKHLHTLSVIGHEQGHGIQDIYDATSGIMAPPYKTNAPSKLIPQLVEGAPPDIPWNTPSLDFGGPAFQNMNQTKLGELRDWGKSMKENLYADLKDRLAQAYDQKFYLPQFFYGTTAPAHEPIPSLYRLNYLAQGSRGERKLLSEAFADAVMYNRMLGEANPMPRTFPNFGKVVGGFLNPDWTPPAAVVSPGEWASWQTMLTPAQRKAQLWPVSE